MTDCEATREAAQAYLDGELAPEDRARLEAHAAGCPSCQRALALQRRLFALLAEPALPEAPAGLTAAVMRRVAAERARAQRWQTRVAAAAALAASAAAVLAWGEMASGAWPSLEGLSLAGLGESLLATWAGLGATVAELGGEWLAVLPSGPAALAGVVALLAANAVLAYRWRGLARPTGTYTARTIR